MHKQSRPSNTLLQAGTMEQPKKIVHIRIGASPYAPCMAHIVSGRSMDVVQPSTVDYINVTCDICRSAVVKLVKSVTVAKRLAGKNANKALTDVGQKLRGA